MYVVGVGSWVVVYIAGSDGGAGVYGVNVTCSVVVVGIQCVITRHVVFMSDAGVVAACARVFVIAVGSGCEAVVDVTGVIGVVVDVDGSVVVDVDDISTVGYMRVGVIGTGDSDSYIATGVGVDTTHIVDEYVGAADVLCCVAL